MFEKNRNKVQSGCQTPVTAFYFFQFLLLEWDYAFHHNNMRVRTALWKTGCIITVLNSIKSQALFCHPVKFYTYKTFVYYTYMSICCSLNYIYLKCWTPSEREKWSLFIFGHVSRHRGKENSVINSLFAGKCARGRQNSELCYNVKVPAISKPTQ